MLQIGIYERSNSRQALTPTQAWSSIVPTLVLHTVALLTIYEHCHGPECLRRLGPSFCKVHYSWSSLFFPEISLPILIEVSSRLCYISPTCQIYKLFQSPLLLRSNVCCIWLLVMSYLFDLLILRPQKDLDFKNEVHACNPLSNRILDSYYEAEISPYYMRFTFENHFSFDSKLVSAWCHPVPLWVL